VESGKIAEYRAPCRSRSCSRALSGGERVSGCRRAMSALDAAFLYLERSGQLCTWRHLHRRGRLDFEQLMRDIDARLHLIPATRSACSRALSLASTMGADPAFDIIITCWFHTLKPPATMPAAKLAPDLRAAAHSRPAALGSAPDRRVSRRPERARLQGASLHDRWGERCSALNVMFDPSPKPAPVPQREAVSRGAALPSSDPAHPRARHTVLGGVTRPVRSRTPPQPRRALAEIGCSHRRRDGARRIVLGGSLDAIQRPVGVLRT